MSGKLQDLPVVTQPTEEARSDKQLVAYRSHRKQMLRWLLSFGKNPKRAEGYAFETVKRHAYRIDQFYRWVWAQEGDYTTYVPTDHADNWIQHLAYGTKSNSHKSHCQTALQALFKWRHRQLGEEEWEPEIRFTVEKSQPRDYLTREQRRKIGEAALEYGSIPGYNDLSPRQRDRWKAYLAQRFGKPKSRIVPQDFDRANG